MRKPCAIAAFAAAALFAGGLGADVGEARVIPADADEWHGSARVEAEPDGVALVFAKAGEVAWNCWSMDQNWEKFEKAVIELDSAADGVELGVAASDDEECTAGFAVTLKKGANEIEIPTAKLFESGLQTKYIRGVALWALKDPVSVTLKRVRLAGPPGDLSKLRRAAQRVLADAEGRDGAFFWYYSAESRTAKVTEEYAHGGARSFQLDFRAPDSKAKGNSVGSYGRFAHDWRGYSALSLCVYNPKERSVRYTVELRDTWISFFGSGFVARQEFDAPPRGWSKAVVPLDGLEGRKGGRGEPGALKLEYMQQILLNVVNDEDRPVSLCVDDVKLILGRPHEAFERTIDERRIPKFGFEADRGALRLPGDLRRIALAGPIGALQAGAAKVAVTPRAGTRMASGDFNSEGVLDDICVRVLLLKSEGRDTIAWLHIDNLYMPARAEMPAILAEKLGVRPENIFWSATHNHNSGAPWASKAFTDQIIAGFTQAAEEAAARMRPVRVGIARTNARFNFNRVMKGPDGNCYSTLDSKYMSGLEDSRPTDTELATVWFVGADSKPVAGVVYYTGHANMLCRVMPWLSGDWSGWTERLLEDASGAVVMHVQGPLGDTDMRDICISYDRTIRAGWDVAHASMRATQAKLTGVDPSALAGVSVRHGEGQGTPLKEGQAKQKLPVHVLTLGPIAFADLGGETWARFGLELRAKSPYPYTYLNFSSGYYFPEEWAFDKKMYGTQDRRPDWGGVLRDTALRMLNEAAGRGP